MQTEQDKINELNSQAWEIRVSDSTKALALSADALERARQADYPKGKAESLRTLGFAHIRLSKFEEARRYLDEALGLFEALQEERGQSDVLEYYGIIQRSQGDYQASLEFLYRALELRTKTGYRDGEALSYYHLGVTYRYLGNLEQALEYFLQSLALARDIQYWVAESYSLNNIGHVYFELGDYANALTYFGESLHIRKRSGDQWGEAGCLDNIGYIHFKKGAYHEAARFCNASLAICKNIGDKKGEGNSLFHLAEIYRQQEERTKAAACATESLHIREIAGDKKGQAEAYLVLADLLDVSLDKARKKQLGFLKSALALAQATQALDVLSRIHNRFYHLYKQRQRYKEALNHLEQFDAIGKEMHLQAVNQKIYTLEVTHKVAQSKKEAEIYRLRNVELAGLYEETNRQKEALQQALSELRATQAQLIQSEKMASLGELTAGIAHEIQNPLNFINNFSEVNTELLTELKEEIHKENSSEAKYLANTVIENEQKINHHGKRADAIVKGMLQHSRKNSGEQEPTDINALCDEYLRLSYHGLRVKDKEFNADFKIHFDESIGKVTVVPQDIGRVLLNLFNNAFYAVNERKKQGSEDYEPTVFVSTKKLADKIEVTVADNGMGILKSLKDKIFQPFFTTKPTGKGTGLGLSLSYDITKAHGGELSVESKEGEGSTFVIRLPV